MSSEYITSMLIKNKVERMNKFIKKPDRLPDKPKREKRKKR